MSKSNTEIAREVVDRLAEKRLLHYDVANRHELLGGSVIAEAISIIESALTTAQSDLARQVIAEIGTVNAIGIKTIVKRKVRDLFTRLQIEIGGSE